jgi:hypothetical protein
MEKLYRIVKLSESKPGDNLLIFDGCLQEVNVPQNEIEEAAKQWAMKHSSAPDKDFPDWVMTDFKGGVKWLIDRLQSPQPKP